MLPFLVLLILAGARAVATFNDGSVVSNTPAAHFWEKALPGTPLPPAIADLIQKGVYLSRLVDRYNLRDCPDKQRCTHLPLPDDVHSSNAPVSSTVLWNCIRDCPGKAVVPQGLFFHRSQVRVGSTMTVFLPVGADPAILPRNIAEKVPFGNLSDVLSMFDISPNSAEASMVGGTLNRCQASSSAISGERKLCSTSLEGTVQSAMSLLGTSRVWAVASALPSAGLPRQSYVVRAVRPLAGTRHVGCHLVPYPYAVYECHVAAALQSEVYILSLRGAGAHDGETFAMAAICHLNTSKWSPAYPAFEILGTRPGGAPVCHFLQYATLVFGDKKGNN